VYVSWQLLNALYKGKATPTTDKGWMYATGGPSGAFHVKWHQMDKSPAVDRFHVTFEGTSKKTYYRITSDGSFVYLGNRPDSGGINAQTAAQFAGKTPLSEFDDIAAVFLKNVNGQLSTKVRTKLSDAVADDEAIDKAGDADAERKKLVGELRSKYSAYTEAQFTKAGLQKLGINSRYEWTPQMYADAFAKIEAAANGTPVPTTPTVSTPTTASSPVFAGSKVPLPTPTGYAVSSNGPITTYKPWNKPSGSTPAPTQSGAPKPWHTQSTAPQRKPWDK
jgi:hypothetical protein